MGSRNEIDRRVSLASCKGECMGRALEEIFGQIGLDVDLVRRNGAVALDVEYGPEILALANLGVKEIIACEPELCEDTEIKFEVLERVAKENGAEVVRGDGVSALVDIQQSRPDLRVGVVTQLNAFPTGIRPDTISKVMKAALPLLADDGRVIISTNEDDWDTEERMQKILRARIEGVELKFMKKREEDYGSAGNLFLVGKKKS